MCSVSVKDSGEEDWDQGGKRVHLARVVREGEIQGVIRFTKEVQ